MALLDLPISGHRLAAVALNEAMGMKMSQNCFIGRGHTTQRLYTQMVVLGDRFGSDIEA
jgi:hypothetical protein